MTAISLCAANSQASPSAGFATNAMANAQSAIPTFDLPLLCEFATNAHLAITRINVSYVAARYVKLLNMSAINGSLLTRIAGHFGRILLFRVHTS